MTSPRSRCACRILAGLFVCAAVVGEGIAAPSAQRHAPVAATFFKTPLSPAEMAEKQAVVETSAGTFVVQLLPESAPNHVGYFITRARAAAYDGTTFHRAVRFGIVQGGDPLSKDPAKRELYGTGGLGVLRRELNAEPMTAGAVAAVLQPGKPDSGGAQFFIAVTDQAALQGQYTVFGRVVEGMEVVRKISEAPVDSQGKIAERIAMTRVTIRDTPPVEAEAFSTENIAELGGYQVVLETSRGPITVAFLPEKAPNHVRNFLRLAALGAYDGTSFHRVVPGFVVQGGMLNTRRDPVTQKMQSAVRNLQPEFNDTPHVKGIVSMARLDDPASASTSFFICTGLAPSLDGKYTAFGRVIDGLAVVDALDALPVDGETPRERVEIVKARVEKR
jgi:peptidyl-prolyl cis-trans isomerase B (cyclophilin B)